MDHNLHRVSYPCVGYPDWKVESRDEAHLKIACQTGISRISSSMQLDVSIYISQSMHDQLTLHIANWQLPAASTHSHVPHPETQPFNLGNQHKDRIPMKVVIHNCWLMKDIMWLVHYLLCLNAADIDCEEQEQPVKYNLQVTMSSNPKECDLWCIINSTICRCFKVYFKGYIYMYY